MIPRWAVYAVIGGVLAVMALWGARWLVKTGERLQEAQYEASQAKYDRAQVIRLENANADYAAKNHALQARADDLLANPPHRIIRVPVSAACPTPQPGNAGVPQPSPSDGHVDVVDTGYDSFRDWLIRYAAGPDNGRRTNAAVSPDH